MKDFHWQAVGSLWNQQNGLLLGGLRMGMGRMFVMPVKEKSAALDAILGCRFKDAYNNTGVVESYCGPFWDGSYTLAYRDESGIKRWLSKIQTEKDVVTCGGAPLRVGKRVENVQTSLF